MDDETRSILKTLNQAMQKQQKPIWVTLLQQLVIPILTVLFTVVVTLNKVENQYIKRNAVIEKQFTHQETEDLFIRGEIQTLKTNQEHNNKILSGEINLHFDSHVQLVPLR